MARFPVPAIYLAAMFALNVYRAATQSFVIDEGYSYQLYIGREPFALFRHYDANLHVLHTLLTWLSVKVFGLSELTFRLPSLIGCALYYSGVHRLSGMVFPGSWRRLLAVVLLTVNPLVFDHMSVGRGYGLALGFFAWAFCEAVAATPRLPRLALLLALSVASNLVFLFPAVALLVMMARTAAPSALVRELVGPWLVLTFLLLVMPFSRIEPGAFYYGADTLDVSIQSIVEPSIGGRKAIPTAVAACSWLVLAGCLAAIWRFRRSPGNSFEFLSSGTLVLTVLAVVSAHLLFGVLYPWARTGIYVAFLLPVCLLPLIRWKAGAIAILALSVAMAQGIRIDRYVEWPFDANSRQIAAELVSRHASGAPPVRVACRLPVCHSLRLYLAMWRLDWAHVEELDSWAPGFDYYLLTGDVEQEAATLGLRVVYVGPSSGTALAEPARDAL